MNEVILSQRDTIYKKKKKKRLYSQTLPYLSTHPPGLSNLRTGDIKQT